MQSLLPAHVQVYLVGGAVRDALLGQPEGDRDYVVVGADTATMRAAGFKQVGRDFPVFLHPHTGEEYALARTERKAGHGYGGFVVHAAPDVSLEEDLRRRDFTINAIARDANGQLHDPFGGIVDLHNKQLRHVSDAFNEDPLRVLRAARLMAKLAPLGFVVAEQTLQRMRAMCASGELTSLTAERVWQELQRALASPAPQAFLQTLRQVGALAVVLPEVDALYGVPQRAEYHPEIDTGLHTEMVCAMCAQLAPGDALIGFLGLTHDLGKALTPKDILPAHYQHEHNGIAPLQTLAERLKPPREYVQLGAHMCREHTNIHNLAKLRASTVHDLITRVDGWRKPQRITQLAIACEADSRGRGGHQQRPYPQASLLQAALTAARPIDSAPLRTKGLQGEKLGQAIRQQRIARIRQVLIAVATASA